MVGILRDRGFASVSELCRELGVSRTSIHRYLQELKKEGIVELVHGGAIFSGVEEDKFPSLSSYENREDPLYEERQRIGKKATELVKPYDSIALGTGRTTFALAKYLKEEKKKVHIFTPSLSIAYLLKDSVCEVTVSGGAVFGEEGYLIGPGALEFLEGKHIQKAFIGAGGVNIEKGVTNHNPLVVEVEKKIVSNSQEIILITASTKFNQVAPYQVMTLEKINTVVTTKNIPHKIKDYLREKGIRLILA